MEFLLIKKCNGVNVTSTKVGDRVNWDTNPKQVCIIIMPYVDM